MSPGRLPRDLDPALPDLDSALDPSHVARRFERRWPGPDRPSVVACIAQQRRWTPGVGCVATYQLALAGGSGHGESTIGVVTVDPEGVRHRLFSDDEELGGIAAAKSEEAVGGWLAERLRLPVGSWSVTPVRYWPGARCVFRYTPARGDGPVLYGKVLGGDQAADLAAVLASLGDGLVPALVGLAPQWQLIVQADGGSTLRSAEVGGRPAPPTLAQLRESGGLLARLHARSGPAGPCRALAGDGAELGQYLSAAQRVSPRTAALMEEGTERVRALACHALAAAPAHGDFRLAHVHATAQGPRLIDLDSYCWAEPERDVGNLLAFLRWRAMCRPHLRRPLAQIRSACLAGYSSVAPRAMDRARLRAFEAASLLKIAGRRYRSLAAEEWDHVPRLVMTALELLGSRPAPRPCR